MINFLRKIFGITTVDYKSLIKNGGQIIDVRSPQEYKSGHIKNSKNIPLQTLSSKLNMLDKKSTIIAVCASGIRSSNAKRILKTNGFDAYNGGAWQQLKNKLS